MKTVNEIIKDAHEMGVTVSGMPLPSYGFWSGVATVLVGDYEYEVRVSVPYQYPNTYQDVQAAALREFLSSRGQALEIGGVPRGGEGHYAPGLGKEAT